jgi:hypothetical protein
MRVYFYCRNEPGILQEDVVTLAEGFRELGVPFSGNCNYWLQSTEPGDYLIKHSPDILPEDCDVVVVNYLWPLWMKMGEFKPYRCPLPEGLFKRGRRYQTVYMDNHDGHQTVSWEPEYRNFDVILRSQLSRRAWHPENMKPWVLGFTNRVVKATANALPFAERKRAVLVNFGASHPYGHGVRTLAAQTFLPRLEKLIPFDTTKDDLKVAPEQAYERLMWEQTGMRFSQPYYNRLKSNQAVACFCGDIIPPAPWKNPGGYLVGGNKAKFKRAFFEALAKVDPRPPRSVQWDSFRAWETWVAGCANINIDLDLYGPQLPVMPENWKHYIGVDLSHPNKAIERLRDDPSVLERVAREGRAWALENYSPRAMAERMLAHLGVSRVSS